jgi:hypothetical protein
MACVSIDYRYTDSTSKGKKVVRDIFKKGDAAFRSGKDAIL